MTDLSQLTDAQLLALSQGGSPTIQVQPLPPVQGTNSRGQPLAGPDYNQAFDPSKLTDAQLLAAQADSNPHMSTGEDVLRSGLGGLQEGVAGLAAVPRGVADLAHSALQAGADFVTRRTGGGHIEMPAVDQLLHAPGLPSTGALVQAVVGQGAKLFGINPTIAQLAVGGANPSFALAGPGPGDVATAINNGLPTHTPQTAAGRYTKRVTEFAPLVTAPASLPGRLAAAITPGLASQGLEDVAPQGLKPVAALVGAVLGGGVNGAAGRVARAPQASFGAALGDVTEEQMAAAQALRQSAAARGINLTVPEAVQQVTNSGTGLARLQHTVENTERGKALTAPYFANRPSQVAQAVRSYADKIAPASDQPGMIAQRAQGAATTALDQARQVVNRAAAPDYAALPNQSMDPEAYQALADNPSYKMALTALRENPELGAQIAHLPDNNIAVVNAVKQRLATLGELAKGTPLAPGDNQLASVRFAAKADADDLARQASPEYAAANDTVRDLSGQYIEPLKAGPIGAISATNQLGDQTAALYPAQPYEGAPSETSKAVRVFGVTAPGVAEDLTRQHLVNALNTSMKDLQGGQNQYAGAKYAVTVAGNPEQAATLRSGISELPEGPAKVTDLDSLLEALRATGKRSQPGSMTAFNAQALQNLQIAPSAQAIGRIADPLEWGKALGDILNRANYRRNVSRLAQMIMADPGETSATLEAARKAAARSGGSSMLPAILRGGHDEHR